jgi:hypothetical protein
MPKPALVFVDPLEALRGEVADLSRRRVELRGAREALLLRSGRPVRCGPA